MRAVSYAADVFAKSGGVGLVTALLFFVCLGVGLERLLFWRRLLGGGGLRALLGGRRTTREMGRIEASVRASRFADAAKEAGRSGRTALRLLGTALGRLRNPQAWESVRDAALTEELGGSVTLGRRFLMTSIQCFGLLGMLGTCKGLYTQLSSFGALAANGSSIQTAMGGMGEAFTTTLVGLTAAVLATLIYVPNELAVDCFQRQLRQFDCRIQAALAESAGAGGPSPGPAARKGRK